MGRLPLTDKVHWEVLHASVPAWASLRDLCAQSRFCAIYASNLHPQRRISSKMSLMAMPAYSRFETLISA